MSFYSQLLDSVYYGNLEQTAALTILKLQAIDREPARYSTTTAISSPLILSEHCAGNQSFLKLVSLRRIQFWRWPDKGPREALDYVLTLPPNEYLFSGWHDAINKDPFVRTALRERLSDGKTSSRIDELDQRIDFARHLFAAVDTAQITAEEDERGAKFAERMLVAFTLLKEQDPRVRGAINLLTRVSQLDKTHRERRSTLVDWIKGRADEYSPCDINIAEDVIHGEYNKCVAQSLHCRLHAAYRVLEDPPLGQLLKNRDRCAISTVSLPDVTKLPIEPLKWSTVCNVAEGAGIDQNGFLKQQSARGSKDLFAERFATLYLAGPSGETTVILDGFRFGLKTGLVLGAGSLVRWFLGVLKFHGAAAAVQAGMRHTLTAGASKKLSGFLDRVERPN